MSKSAAPAWVPGTRTNTLVALGEPKRRTSTLSYLAGVPGTKAPLTLNVEVSPDWPMTVLGAAHVGGEAPNTTTEVVNRTGNRITAPVRRRLRLITNPP